MRQEAYGTWHNAFGVDPGRDAVRVLRLRRSGAGHGAAELDDEGTQSLDGIPGRLRVELQMRIRCADSGKGRRLCTNWVPEVQTNGGK